ncbi:glucosamine-6-phosphate deaminase [Paenibacillus thalictri]|uniref:Glucosamine-6-phosphate deaminase n=1 Tax=Paenibacillus thalictri TaxID=2527873 RepID=A0A4Q9DMF8_9BACL|nr:glucosamine-6-phosphate deaminase [Paenibacillus thalictri]TBL75279.1 glucosamine-6-phosphate deaminase [Paenibacillus thalictri]
MEIKVYSDYDAMCAATAKLIADHVRANPEALLSFAAGSSPLGVFAKLIEAAKSGTVSFARCRFVSLDEWAGLDGSAQGSCRQTLDEHFFKPLAVPEPHIRFFDGKAGSYERECEEMDAYIAGHGGIGLILLGVGMNGHLGFNEPGASFEAYSHVSRLDETTKHVSVKYFGESLPLTQGITLGIRHMMEADQAILIADGLKKADIVHEALNGEVTNRVPASILQRHNNCAVYLDAGAASKLKPLPNSL